MSEQLSDQYASTHDADSANNINKSHQYTPLHRINHSSIPRHRGKQKSFFSLATELSHYTRLSSRQSNFEKSHTNQSVEYSKIASVISAYSSFIPQDNQDLLQIEYRFDKTAKSKSIPMFYTINIILFINSTTQVARYLLLIISLSLTLTYTMKPSYIQIIKYKFPLDQSTVPYNVMIGIGDIKPWIVLGVLFGVCYLCITLGLTGILFVCLTTNSGNIDCTPFIFMVLFASNTFSMLLITGHPANVIVSEAVTLSYNGNNNNSGNLQHAPSTSTISRTSTNSKYNHEDIYSEMEFENFKPSICIHFIYLY